MSAPPRSPAAIIARLEALTTEVRALASEAIRTAPPHPLRAALASHVDRAVVAAVRALLALAHTVGRLHELAPVEAPAVAGCSFCGGAPCRCPRASRDSRPS
jgi:hypothetical protein